MKLFAILREWARRIRRDAIAVYIAARDPRTPAHVKVLAFAVAAYALSPIDLIPDFIPVLGYLDDLLLIPAGIWAVVRLLPLDVLVESRAKAEAVTEKPRSRVAVAVIVGLWAICAIGLSYCYLRVYGN